MPTYAIRPDTASVALRGLHGLLLSAAQAAVVVGGASPRAVLAEIRHVLARLQAAGWERLSRREVVPEATITERPQLDMREVGVALGLSAPTSKRR